MKLTKFKHACFAIQKNGRTLLVDPGNLTSDLSKLVNVTAVVITHQHPDHYDESLITTLLEDHPGLTIYTHKELAELLPLRWVIRVVTANESLKAGPFSLEFFGEDHAVIHPNIPQISNIGVMINKRLFYPGDSFTKPDKPVDMLALPVAAPWMKIAEAIDYANEIKPRFIFPTHDAILSEGGHEVVDRIISGNIDSQIEYKRLVEPIDV